MAWMEAKLGLREEVQNEAEGEEAEEEGPWVRSFIPFLFCSLVKEVQRMEE